MCLNPIFPRMISEKKQRSLHSVSFFRLSKEMNDLATYCPERRAADKFEVSGSYFIMSEVAEVASAMLDAKLVSMFKKFPDAIDTIHFSDQVIRASHWSDVITHDLILASHWSILIM